MDSVVVRLVHIQMISRHEQINRIYFQWFRHRPPSETVFTALYERGFGNAAWVAVDSYPRRPARSAKASRLSSTSGARQARLRVRSVNSLTTPASMSGSR